MLVVEDDQDVQRLLQRLLRDQCESLEVAADGEQALQMLQNASYDVVILDLMLPKVNGFAVADAIQAMKPRPKIVVLSAISRYFADRFPDDCVVLQKPFDIRRLEEALRTIGVT